MSGSNEHASSTRKNSSPHITTKRIANSQIIGANNDLSDENKASPSITEKMMNFFKIENSGKLSSHIIDSRRLQKAPPKDPVQTPSNLRDPNIGNLNHASQRNAQKPPEGLPVSKVRTAVTEMTIKKLRTEYTKLTEKNNILEKDRTRYRAERNSVTDLYNKLCSDYDRLVKDDDALLEAMEKMKKNLEEAEMENQRQHDLTQGIIEKLKTDQKKMRKDEEEKQHQHDAEKRRLISQQQKSKAKSESLADALEQMKNQEKMRKDEEERQRRHDSEKKQLIDQQQKSKAKSESLADALEQMKKNQEKMRKDEEEKQRRNDDEKRQLVDQQKKAEAKSESLVKNQEKMRKDEEERQRQHDDEKRQLIDQQQKAEAKSESLADALERMKMDEEIKQRLHDDEKKQLLDQYQKMKAEYDLKIYPTLHSIKGSTNTLRRQQNEEPDGALKDNEAALRQELKNAEGKLSELSYEIRCHRKQEQDYANRLESAEGEKSAMSAKIVELEQQLQREISFRPQEHDTDDIDNGLYAMDGANPVTFSSTRLKLYQAMRSMVDNMIARGALKSDDIQKWYYDQFESTTIPTNMSRIARPSKRVQKRVVEHHISNVLATIWNVLVLGENVEYRAADKMFAELELAFEEIQLLQPAPIIGSEIAALITRTKSEFATLLLDRLPKPVDVEKALKEDPNFNPFSTLPSKITTQIIIFCNAKINAVFHALSIFAKEEVLKDWMSNIMLLVYISVHLRLQMEAMEKQGRMVAFFAGSDNDRRAILNAGQTEQMGVQDPPYQSVPAPRLQSNLHNASDSVNKAKKDEEFKDDEYVFLTVFPGVGKVRVIDKKFVMDDQVDNQCTVLSC